MIATEHGTDPSGSKAGLLQPPASRLTPKPRGRRAASPKRPTRRQGIHMAHLNITRRSLLGAAAAGAGMALLPGRLHAAPSVTLWRGEPRCQLRAHLCCAEKGIFQRRRARCGASQLAERSAHQADALRRPDLRRFHRIERFHCPHHGWKALRPWSAPSSGGRRLPTSSSARPPTTPACAA